MTTATRCEPFSQSVHCLEKLNFANNVQCMLLSNVSYSAPSHAGRHVAGCSNSLLVPVSLLLHYISFTFLYKFVTGVGAAYFGAVGAVCAVQSMHFRSSIHFLVVVGTTALRTRSGAPLPFSLPSERFFSPICFRQVNKLETAWVWGLWLGRA
jgi:hypothetical protein